MLLRIIFGYGFLAWGGLQIGFYRKPPSNNLKYAEILRTWRRDFGFLPFFVVHALLPMCFGVYILFPLSQFLTPLLYVFEFLVPILCVVYLTIKYFNAKRQFANPSQITEKIIGYLRNFIFIYAALFISRLYRYVH